MNRQLGMTLMELTIGLAVIAIVAVTAGSMFVAGMRSFQTRHVGNMVMADLRFAMDTMTRDLMSATAVVIPTANPAASKVDFTSPGDVSPLTRSYYLSGQTVQRLQGGTVSPLAAHVASLAFALEAGAIRITITSVSTVDGVTGSGLPFTLTTRVIRRN